MCDGHGGDEAAEYIKKRLWDILKSKLPDRQPDRKIGFAAWAGDIRHALIQACTHLDADFSDKHGDWCDAGTMLISQASMHNDL